MTFTQKPPELGNQYLYDPILSHYLSSQLPKDMLKKIEKDLIVLGETTLTRVLVAGEDAQKHEPFLVQFDAWGNRVDQVITSEGWNQLRVIAADEGLVSIGYARNFGQHSRIYQMAKLLLYTPSSAIFTCPLAMTDGAAGLIEQLAAEELDEVFQHLTSDRSETFWTAGQWMTEKEGGSDIGNSSTIARRLEGREYSLYGDKWFTSAITGDIAMTLARIEDEDGNITQGSRGLSLFYLRIRDEEGRLNGIKINKLKDKLGTRALPTAELTLDGSRAILLGEIGRGVKQISIILNITRIYNSLSSISYMARGLALAKDYASRREAFTKKLIDLPLHRQVLIDLEMDYLSSFLVFYVIELLGKVETDQATEEEIAILRILTPLAKLYTGKLFVAFLSEVLEAFGGIGYIEETGIPALLRDAQVFPIWEGTTNVLSLDVLRSIQKEKSLQPLLSTMNTHFSKYQGPLDIGHLVDHLQVITNYAKQLQKATSELQELAARQFSLSLARLVAMFRVVIFQQETTNTHLRRKLELLANRSKIKLVEDLKPIEKSYFDENKAFFSTST